MKLPLPCPRCKDSDWPVVIERHGSTGAGRCACARGRELARLDANPRLVDQEGRTSNMRRPEENAPGISDVAAMAAVERLAILMRMVPSGDAAHAAIAEELQRFVCDPAGLAWLVSTAPIVFRSGWPEIAELRALYCRYDRPKDGIEQESGIFADDAWPVLPGLPLFKQIEAGPKRGGEISGDAPMTNTVRELARSKSMAPLMDRRRVAPEYLIPAEER